MEIITLVENKSLGDTLGVEHGLSLFVRTKGKNILFDMGKGDLFLKNAETLHCSIAAVDLAVISHGHYDHGGGLRTFLEENDHAPVCIRKSAFERHLSLRKNGEKAYIGLDTSFADNERLVFTGDLDQPENGLTLFSNVKERAFFSGCNNTILMEKDGTIVPDDFVHEQNMILREEGKTVLIAGCAHSGIVNILRRAEQIIGRMPDVVIGGFHLYSPSLGTSEPEECIRAVGKALYDSGAVFYTGHCTGEGPFEQLKTILGDRLHEMHTGTVVNV